MQERLYATSHMKVLEKNSILQLLMSIYGPWLLRHEVVPRYLGPLFHRGETIHKPRSVNNLIVFLESGHIVV